MLTTFTTEHGLLVIRSEDLRRLCDIHTPDTPDDRRCLVHWLEHDRMQSDVILGTAEENRDRIVAEETRAIAVYEDMRRRADTGSPALPVVRGGKVVRR